MMRHFTPLSCDMKWPQLEAANCKECDECQVTSDRTPRHPFTLLGNRAALVAVCKDPRHHPHGKFQLSREGKIVITAVRKTNVECLGLPVSALRPNLFRAVELLRCIVGESGQ